MPWSPHGIHPQRRPRAGPGASRRARARLGLALPLLVVLVEALAALRAEAAREDHAAEERRRRHVRLAELVEEDLRDVEVDVEAGVVEQLERSHRVAEPELHRLVDVFLRRHTLLERADRTEEVGDHEAVHDETGRVLADDRDLPDLRHEFAQRADGLGARRASLY